MLTSKTLERVSCSYRRGYNDGYSGREAAAVSNDIPKINDDTIGGTIRPFADFDYEQGYKAGATDKWAEGYTREYVAMCELAAMGGYEDTNDIWFEKRQELAARS